MLRIAERTRSTVSGGAEKAVMEPMSSASSEAYSSKKASGRGAGTVWCFWKSGIQVACSTASICAGVRAQPSGAEGCRRRVGGGARASLR
eukprot:7652309-Heterocapsa_arctica.AAC.1